MSTYYLDTSAAVKLYVNESGSDWLRRLLSAPSPNCLEFVPVAC